MRAKTRKVYNRSLDCLATILFPANKLTRFWIGNHQLHSTEITVAIYTLLIGVVLAWYFANWLWFPATVLTMVMAWMLAEWFL